MEVRKGYKQTEVGVIPKDWDVLHIRDLKPFVTSGSRGWAAFYAERGDPFIRITNLSRGSIYLDLEDLRFVKLLGNETEAARTQLQNGDVLISVTADIGIVGYVTSRLPKPAYINQHIALIRFDITKANSRFISYFLAAEHSQKIFLALTDSGAKAGMNLTTVQNLYLALPPTLAEQEAIAEALSDADALIESLETLLAKKRQVKQGAMSELLTGKRRLSGFSGKWQEMILDDFVTFSKGSGLSKNKIVENGKRKCILYGELFTSYNRIIKNVLSSTNSNEGILSVRGDILMPGSTTTTGIDLAIASALMVSDVALGGDVNILRSKKTIDYSPEFLANYLTSVSRKSIAEITQGITIHHLYGKNLKTLSVKLPEFREQTAIAEILSDMDAEIRAVEEKLSKARAVKAGMMSALLTGRVRLM